MDPNDILALIAGGGGAFLVIGAGAWAVLRGRGGRGRDAGTNDQQGPESTSSSTGAPTATKERPAAPTWADTLSAPAEPAGLALRPDFISGARAAVIVEPRSACLLQGPARHEWEHSIPAMDRLRYSVTFRSLKG